MRIDLFLHVVSSAESDKLDAILLQLTRMEKSMSQNQDALVAAVTADTDAVSSAVTLLQGLSQQIKDAGTDQTKLDALTAQLDGNTKKLADAVVANTPAASPTPGPIPVV